ncbi:protein NPGR2 isoform X2 [Spinacia oleracea]|nr:protein NPGR2-like isoform X2 [Spinacia oleracea]XP_021847657.1 protein NPGR2-like isoform X2 [Spinacia oleracea]XP_021847659.1 protein NPGR2-like isoform X2 [Spinacia oleracea]
MKAKPWRKSEGSGGRGRLKKMMKCIFLGKQVRADEAAESSDSSLATRDYSASGFSGQGGEIEPKTTTSTIEEAESSLRASGYLNYEEARALLGRLEYQKGNVEAAFRVFEGIDIDAVTPNIKVSLARKCEGQRRNSQSDAVLPMSMHAVNLLFEAIFLKAKSLQALGRFEEAAQSCQVIVDTVESAIPQGLNGRFSTNSKLQETLNNTVELLPELWKLALFPNKVISSYRHALLYDWNLEMGTQARIEKEFAIFLLYSGIDASPPTLRFQVEGAYIPSDNVEEAILLFLLSLRKFLQGSIDWDPSIMDHLSFALSTSGDLGILARQLEELPAGTIDRKDNYGSLALCYHGLGEDKVSLNLLRNLLKDREIHNCTRELLLASKICTQDTNCSEEGIKYSEKVIKRLDGDCQQLVCKATCLLGILSSAQSKLVTSESKRVRMQSKALDLLGIAEALTKETDPNVIYHLALENAEQRKLDMALSYAKKLLKLEASSGTAGWVLLARILSAQKRYIDAETIVNAALEQTGKWEHAELLRTRAKLEIAQGKTKIAIQTYTHVLAVLQVRKKSCGIGKLFLERKERDKSLEVETWHDLANLYTSLSQWRDAEVCLSKSEALCRHSASRCHSRGLLYEAKGLEKEAQKSFWEALDQDPNHIPSLISMSKLLVKFGEQSLPIATSFIRQAIRLDRTNHMAWRILGLLHRCEPEGGSTAEALECFEAATLLEETAPVEPFR